MRGRVKIIFVVINIMPQRLSAELNLNWTHNIPSKIFQTFKNTCLFSKDRIHSELLFYRTTQSVITPTWTNISHPVHTLTVMFLQHLPCVILWAIYSLHFHHGRVYKTSLWSTPGCTLIQMSQNTHAHTHLLQFKIHFLMKYLTDEGQSLCVFNVQ